jgi:hypothetical protein
VIDRRRLIQLVSAVALSRACSLSFADAPTIKAKRLVLIHGRDQQGQDPKVLKSQWMSALNRGAQTTHRQVPASIDVSFPFYGDQLGNFEKATSIPLTSDIHSRGSARDQSYLEFQYDVAEDIRKKAGVTDEQINAEYGNNPEEHGPLNWSWVQAILRAIDKNGGGINQRTLEVFTRDVYLYCTLPGVHDAINRTVAAALTEEPTVIVAHSLGSVVAYSLLTTDTRKLNVPLMVTVGCPLGVRAIRDLYRPIHSPAPVATWFNAYDPRDVVALYPLDNNNFPVQPPIDNYSKVKNHTDNRHGIDGYLDDPTVAMHISDALGS